MGTNVRMKKPYLQNPPRKDHFQPSAVIHQRSQFMKLLKAELTAGPPKWRDFVSLDCVEPGFFLNHNAQTLNGGVK